MPVRGRSGAEPDGRAEGQDVEFIGDFLSRIGEVEARRILTAMWDSREDKKEIRGIQGTLFYELEFKREFYPTKRESEMTGRPRR